MLVKLAGSARRKRYDAWYQLLQEELELVSHAGTRFIAVGRPVSEYLERVGFPTPFTRIIHYSGQAARARKAGIKGRERSYSAFRTSVTLDDLVAMAQAALEDAGVPSEMREQALARLNSSQLSESRRQLIFCYKTALEKLRDGGP